VSKKKVTGKNCDLLENKRGGYRCMSAYDKKGRETKIELKERWGGEQEEGGGTTGIAVGKKKCGGGWIGHIPCYEGHSLRKRRGREKITKAVQEMRKNQAKEGEWGKKMKKNTNLWSRTTTSGVGK